LQPTSLHTVKTILQQEVSEHKPACCLCANPIFSVCACIAGGCFLPQSSVLTGMTRGAVTKSVQAI